MNRLVIGLDDKTDYLLTREGDIIDPHETLAKEFLKRLDPQKVCYLKPSDTAHPFGFNPLQHGAPDKICEAFDALFPQGQNTLARSAASFVFETYLRTRPPNLLSVLELLRANTTPVVSDKRFDNARTLLEARLGKLLMNPTLRNILCQQTTFSFDKPIVADLSGIGDTAARFLGCLLLACSKRHVVLNDAAFFRYPLPLSEERFTVVCNFLDELWDKQAALGIKDKVVYRTNKKDADELAFYLGVMNPRQLTELDGPYGLEVSIPKPRYRVTAHLKRSRACYTRPKAKVEQQIRHFLAQ